MPNGDIALTWNNWSEACMIIISANAHAKSTAFYRLRLRGLNTDLTLGIKIAAVDKPHTPRISQFAEDIRYVEKTIHRLL